MERHDLGASNAHADIRREMEDRINRWLRARRLRTTESNESVARRTDSAKERGFLFGVW